MHRRKDLLAVAVAVEDPLNGPLFEHFVPIVAILLSRSICAHVERRLDESNEWRDT